MINFKKLKKPFIIAEIGINHEGNIKTAKKLIFEAKKAGADAVKFQIFKPYTLANKRSQKSKFQKKSTSQKNPLYKIWQKMELKFPDLKKLRKYAKKLNIYFICSVFDIESLSMSRKLKIDALKIASSDITDEYLQNYLSKEKKPIILSTGMSEKSEIEKCIKNLKSKNLAILHCVSLYPCDFKRANLNRILSLKENFKYTIGYSDHCIGPIASILSINLGAKIIEKHFTLNKNKIGLDHKLSADPMDLKIICDFAKENKNMEGTGKIEPSKKELKMRIFARKSMFAKKDIQIGERFTEQNITCKRPGYGIEANKYYKILGKRSKKKFKKFEIIKN